jgi:hypothetical protein
MLPGLRRPVVPELFTVCYKSFSLIFGGDGAGGTDDAELVLEFFAVAFSSSSCVFSVFSLVLVVVFDVVAPLLLSGCVSVFCCGCCCVCGAAAFDCQLTSSIDTNFFRRSKY